MALPAQAPVDEYEPNGHGLYNMCGNVWEWVDGGTKEQRVLRGGSYVDSLEGTFNHAIKVSTRCDHRFPALSAAAADPAADRGTQRAQDGELRGLGGREHGLPLRDDAGDEEGRAEEAEAGEEEEKEEGGDGARRAVSRAMEPGAPPSLRLASQFLLAIFIKLPVKTSSKATARAN